MERGHAKLSRKAKRKRPLYRALNRRDKRSIRVGRGIVASGPNAKNTVEQHIMGPPRRSRYISTTKNPAVSEVYDGGNGVAILDSTRIPETIDCSCGRHRPAGKAAALAEHDSEVLAVGEIPQTAIVEVLPKAPRPGAKAHVG